MTVYFHQSRRQNSSMCMRKQLLYLVQNMRIDNLEFKDSNPIVLDRRTHPTGSSDYMTLKPGARTNNSTSQSAIPELSFLVLRTFLSTLWKSKFSFWVENLAPYQFPFQGTPNMSCK